MTLKIQSSRTSIADVEKYVKDLFDRYDIGQDLYPNILISLTEAVTNAIKHGNNYDREKQVWLEARIQTGRLCCIVSDEGDGFDYAKIPDPTAPENLEKPGGRGVFLIHQLSDRVEYHNNGSRVVIEFTI